MAKKKAAKKSAVKKKGPVKKKAPVKKKTKKKPAPKAKATSKSTSSTKKKAKRSSSSAESLNLDSFRGVMSFDTNEVVILVRAPFAKVAEAWNERKKLKLWVKNAIGKSVTIGTTNYAIYQIKEQPWVVIDNFSGAFPSPDDAEDLSKRLATRAIFYGNSDTSCVTQYDVYDSGKLVEHFESGDSGLKFHSQIRKVKPPKDGADIYPFVSDFIEEQDAFVPSWSTFLFDGYRHKKGDKVKLAYDDLNYLVDRFDFLSA